MSPREERVWRVVRAAATLELDEDLVHRIAKSTGLAHEGVRLALEDYLETSPSDADVHALVGRAGHADRVHVILSSTVFTAALRAIAVAWATAPNVVVRPSRRSPEFATALVRAIDDPSVTLAPDLDASQIESGEVQVHGRMDTIARVRKGVRPGVDVRAHGPGLGVAVLGDGDLLEAATALAEDVVVFDQRGCLSPRLVFAIGDGERAKAFGAMLASALDESVPLGELSQEEISEAARFSQTMSFSGTLTKGKGGVVAVSGTPLIPPSGRHVHVVYGTIDDARLHIEELSAFVTAVGIHGNVDPIIAPAHARVSPFGRMQHPPLDGPVDRRAP